MGVPGLSLKKIGFQKSAPQAPRINLKTRAKFYVKLTLVNCDFILAPKFIAVGRTKYFLLTFFFILEKKGTLWFREKRNIKSQQDLDLLRMAKRQKMSALQLEDLPDEMLEKVFSYLKIGDLIQSGHVSKRLRNIWNIESLWQSVELVGILTLLPTGKLTTGYKVQTDFINFLLDKGCQYLKLKEVELTGGR